MITATPLVVKTKITARNGYLTWAFIPFLEKGADTLSLTPPPGHPPELTPCRKTGTQAYARIGSRKVSRRKQPSDGSARRARSGRAPRPPTKRPRHPGPILLYPVVLPEKAPTLQARTSCEPTDQNATQRSAAASHPTNPNPPANPPIKPLSPAQAPRQERENPAHRPRLRRAQPPPPPCVFYWRVVGPGRDGSTPPAPGFAPACWSKFFGGFSGDCLPAGFPCGCRLIGA